MNLTISSSKPKLGRNLKAQFIAGACGLALAAAALTSANSPDSRKTVSPIVGPSQPTSITAPQRGTSHHTVFIAGSEQQVVDVRASLLQDMDPSWYGTFSFVVEADPSETFTADALDEAARSEAGSYLRVIDLRLP